MPLVDYFMALLQLMRLYGVRCGVDEGCVFHNVPYSLRAVCVALFRDSQYLNYDLEEGGGKFLPGSSNLYHI